MSIDNQARVEVIREICNREGHGDLLDTTTIQDYKARRDLLCQRGCGIRIFELERAMTLDELQEFLTRRKLTGTVRLRGRVEITPEDER